LLSALSVLAAGLARAAAPPSGAAAEEVVVAATLLNSPIESLSQSATVMTERDFAPRHFTDLTELLRTLPGIEFRQAGPPGQFNSPRLRGFSDGILVVIDGIKVIEPVQGGIGNLLGQFDPDIIERIEILRGPQATLYGANSTSGVIAITTKSGSVRNLSLKGEYGSLEWVKGGASWRDYFDVTGGSLGISLNFSKQRNAGVFDYEFGRNQTLQGRLDYAGTSIRAGASFYQTINKSQFAEFTDASCCQTSETFWAWQTPEPREYSGVHQEVLNTYLEHQITDNLVHKLTVGGVAKYFSIHDEPDGLLGTHPAPYDNFSFEGTTYNEGDPVPVFDRLTPLHSYYRDRVTQIDYTLRYVGMDFDGLAGFEYLHMKGRQWGTSGELGGTQDVYSYYAIGQLNLLDDRFTAALGARLDDYSQSWGTKDTYNAGAVFRITEGLSLFGNVGTSFRAPTMTELYSPSEGNPGLKPQDATTFEAGLRSGAFDGRLHWTAVYWNAAVDDVILFDESVPNPGNPLGFGVYTNAAKQKTSGVELDALYEITPAIFLNANYTYTQSETQDLLGQWRPAPHIAEHKGNIGITYDDGTLALNANLYVAGPRWRGARDVQTDAYARLDLSASYVIFERWAIFGRLENALGTAIVEDLGYKQPHMFGLIGLQYSFY
jgi:outer membrane cobalamin receptor